MDNEAQPAILHVLKIIIAPEPDSQIIRKKIRASLSEEKCNISCVKR